MKRWYVVTPEWGEVVPVTDEGQGPMEYGCDVVEVEAETRRDAITFGVRLMLKQHKGWCVDARRDGCNPFAGVKAELVTGGANGGRESPA